MAKVIWQIGNIAGMQKKSCRYLLSYPPDCILDPPPFWRRRGRRGLAMVLFERAMVVSYRLSIVTVALSLTIRPQFVNVSDAQINRKGVVNLGQNLGGRG